MKNTTFGLLIDGKKWTFLFSISRFTKSYKYKFQGQERQDELGLNWDSFKWRNYDYAIGRFMSIDPLAEDYQYNSPYAFAENRVVDGRELEGLEWTSSTSSDGKTVNLNLNVRTVNNTNGYLSNGQVATLASERAQALSSSFGGKDATGRTVNVTVTQSDKATMIWEYNTQLSPDGVKALEGKSQQEIGTIGLAAGITSDDYNTQVNKTQVNVARFDTLNPDDNGNLNFDDKQCRSNTAQVGIHEDGHSGGLQHEDESKNNPINIARQVMNDPNNLMRNGATGTNILPEQRSELIKTVEQQQPK